MGAWSLQPPAADLAPAILGAARLPPDSGTRHLGRIAAAIALAVGIGTAAGLATPRLRHHPATPVSTQQVMQAIGLDAFSDEPSILSDVLEQGPAGQEHGR